jgi:cytidine deaminase
VHSGGYIESAAYNPGLPPLQTAIIDAVTDRMPSYTRVSEVVLVELERGPVQHAPTTKVILEQIAPGAVLTVLTAKWSDDDNDDDDSNSSNGQEVIIDLH